MVNSRLLLLAVLLPIAAFAESVENSIDVRYPDGKLLPVETVQIEGSEYVSAEDVSILYSASKYWRADLLKMTLRIGKGHVKITAENRNVVVDDRVIHLREPVRFREGRMYLPFQLVTEVLPALVDAYPVSWNREHRILTLGAPGVVLMGTWLNYLPDGVEVVVRPSVRCDAEAREEEDGSLSILFPGARIAVDTLPSLTEELTANLGIDSLSWTMEGDTAALRIALSDTLEDFRITREGRPERIVIRLSDTPLFPEGTKESGDLVILTTPLMQRRATRQVVIDPGHGGEDHGCSGSAGLVEKEYTFALATMLKNALRQEYGIAAQLTREEDADLPLGRRTEIANESNGVLFISLHVNGSPVENASGAEVYVHSPGRGMDARIESALEEATRRYEADLVGGVIDQDFRFVPWEAVQVSHRGNSDHLARQVLRELGSVRGLVPRGVREGPFPVLSGANMPAVLVEIGFGTSAGDEQLLMQKGTMQGISAGLARAISNFSRGKS